MKNVLLVGHCDLDNPRIASLVEDNFAAKTLRVKLLNEVKPILEKEDYSLVIINRIGAFDRESGIELIKEVRKCGCSENTPLMLVTNYDDQMKLAVENGGVPGFGKDDMFDTATIETLGKYLS